MNKNRITLKNVLILFLILFISLSMLIHFEKIQLFQPKTVITDRSFYIKLYIAIGRENNEEVSKLLKENINPNYYTPEYGTLLIAAAKKGNSDITKQLINKGADVNKKDENDRTALHWACEKGNIEIVKVLIAAKADFSIKDIFGETPYNIAENNHFQEIMKVLEEAGANM